MMRAVLLARSLCLRPHGLLIRSTAVGRAMCGSCRNEPGSGPVLVVTPLSLRWREAACVVRTSYLVRDTRHIDARCWADGAAGNVAIKLQKQREQLVLDWSGAPPEVLWRCP